jgi:hypothetical protein
MSAAALFGETLQLRQLAQDLTADPQGITRLAPPTSGDHTLRAIAASLVELLASRAGVAPPAWASSVPGLPNALYLVKAAGGMSRLRASCERESPEPLKKRNLLAPANYLQFV